MSNIKLHIINSAGTLDALESSIKAAYSKAIERVASELGLNTVDIVCLQDEKMVIPEIGVGGYTPNRNLVYIYVDTKKDISENELYNTLCHELHHAKRYDGPGYGKTLFDSMIFEGLATAYEAENEHAFIPEQLMARQDTLKLIDNVKEHFTDTDFNHFKWFIYDEGNELPRWAGYEIGFYIVRNYLERTNKKASDLVTEASDIFLEYAR